MSHIYEDTDPSDNTAHIDYTDHWSMTSSLEVNSRTVYLCFSTVFLNYESQLCVLNCVSQLCILTMYMCNKADADGQVRRPL